MTYSKFSVARLKRILKNNKIAMLEIFHNPNKASNDGFLKENKELENELKKRKK